MILIILVSVIIGIAIDMTAEKKKDLYEGTLLISESSNSEFTIFYPINKYLSQFDVKKKQNSGSIFYDNFLIIDSETSLGRFINEFYYKEVLAHELKKINYIRKEITNLAEYDEQKKLLDYTKLFNINPIPQDNIAKYRIVFQWPDPLEGKQILIEVIDQISKKIYKKVLDDIENAIFITKNVEKIEDFQRIKFLSEQLEIATTLGIEDIDYSMFSINNTENRSLNNNQNDDRKEINYFLKGKKVIKKEIDIIKKRDYEEFKQIEKYLENLKNSNERIKWVNYNPNLIEIREIENSNSYLQLMVILSLVIVFFYGIVSYSFKRK